MALYKITHPATGKVVNLYISSQTGPVPNGTRLSLYSWQNNNDQKWQLESVGGPVILRLARDTTKVINRSSSNNAHVWTYDGTTETQYDSFIDTETTSGNTRIKLVHRGLYLTKNANDNFLSWAGKINDSRQYFKLEEVSGGGVQPGGTTIPMSVNLNQKYTGNSAGVRNTGCALCCGVDIASFKHGCVYSISDFAGHYYEGIDEDTKEAYASYNWTGPNGFAFNDDEWLTSINEAQTIQVIRNYVNQGIPVACHATGANNKQHWFVAYSTTSNGGSTWETSGITVLDPFNGVYSDYNGRRVPIATAMSDSKVTWGIDRIRVPK